MSDHEHEPTAPAPGSPPNRPRWLTALLLTVVIAVAVVVLFTWVFPWVEEMTQDPTMGAQLVRLPR